MSIKWTIPVEITFNADSPEEAKLRCDEFMLRAVSEFRRDYSIIEYETLTWEELT